MKQLAKCVVCGEKEVWRPEGHCKDCWHKRVETLRGEKDKFRLSRHIRKESTEYYFIFHNEVDRTCGFTVIIKENNHFHITCVLHPNLDWEKICYEDPTEKYRLSNVIMDVITEDLLLGWWEAKKYLIEVYYSTDVAGEMWEGEL